MQEKCNKHIPTTYFKQCPHILLSRPFVVGLVVNYRSGMKICSAFFLFPQENQRISVIPSKLFIRVLTWCKIITSHPFFHLGNVLNQANTSFHVLSSRLLRPCQNTQSCFCFVLFFKNHCKRVV